MSSSVESRLTGVSRATADVPARLRPPVVTSTEIPRERLVRALEVPNPVALVCGPAGSGKTSLVASWVAQQDTPTAWVSLDRHDDDPGRLWTSVLTALRGTGLFPPGARLHDLAAPVGDVAPTFVETVMDAIGEQGGPLLLVLDDVHALHDAAALDSVRMLAHQVPSFLRLVLVSRSEPPIGLPRLRLRGLVTDLGPTELAFTPQESAELAARQGVELPEDALQLLQERAEGWVAGITIAVMAMGGTEDPEAFVERFGGDDHAVADYLISEVLTTLPDDVRAFLQRTSICAEVNPGLAQQLTGRTDAGAVLETLVRENTFTRRLGRGRATYRYHELLRTFLMADLRRNDPDAETDLHRVAATWLAESEPLHAMEHLVAAGDLATLVDLARAHGMPAVLRGRSRWLAAVLDALPGPARSVPLLALLGAAAEMELDDLDRADGWLLGLDLDALAAGEDAVLAALAATVGAARARYTPRVDLALERLESTAAGSTGPPDLDLYALYHRGVTRMFVGRYEESISDLTRAGEIARVTGRDAARVACLSFLAGAMASNGSLLAMREPAEEALALAQRLGWARSAAVAHAHLLVGWSDYLLGDTEVSRAGSQLAVTSLGQHNDPDVELAVRSLEAVVAGEGPDAYEAVRAYRATFARLGAAQMSPALVAYAIPLVLRICLAIAERGWAKELVEAVSQRSPGPGETAYLRALLHHDAGSTDAARAELAAVERGQAPCHTLLTRVQAGLLGAEIEHGLGNAVRAHERLVAALEVAEPELMIRPFLDRPAIGALLRSGTGRFGRHEAFVARVLARMPAPTDDGEDAHGRLTATELAMLRELPSMLSLQEIADAHSVSVNTVKSHLRAVYRKLGVTGRRGAVEVGRGACSSAPGTPRR